jgi:hypothetical protein
LLVGAWASLAAAEPSRSTTPLHAAATRPATPVLLTSPEGARVAQRIVALSAEQQRDRTAVRQAGVAGLGRDVPFENLLGIMVAYAAAASKEAREDRKLTRTPKDLELTLKGAGLVLQNEAIDAGMREAKEKADAALEAATLGLVMGLAQGLIQIGTATASSSGGAGGSSASGVSDLVLVAGAAKDVTGALPPEVLSELQARVDEFLSRVTRAWETDRSITAAMTGFMASSTLLSKVDRAKLLPLLVLGAYEKALDEVKTATAVGKPPPEAKVRRARLSIAVLRSLARKLRAVRQL